jgi:hypothetical protein
MMVLTMAFVKAQAGPANYGDPEGRFTVQYLDTDGNMTIRSGGKRTWRCNNPGNLKKSPYSMSKKRRAIGFAGDISDVYAVYPDYETGHEALIVMLLGNIYSPLTLKQASKRYVESDPDHIHKIVKMTKLDPNRTIKSLTDKEFEIYWKAIEENEGWEVGREDFIEKWYITGVHKKRGVITEYLIEKNDGSTWISKEQGLKLALEGRLHAILVHMKNGRLFLRPEFGSKSFELAFIIQKNHEEVFC